MPSVIHSTEALRPPYLFCLVTWPSVIISNQMTKYRQSRGHYLFKMAAVGMRKSLPLFRHSGVIWQANRYLKYSLAKDTNILGFAVFFSFDDLVFNSKMFFFHRSLRLCCCRLSPGFEALLRNKIYSSHEPKGTNVSVVPKRNLIGSFIPNPLSSSKRKKYSERRILG